MKNTIAISHSLNVAFNDILIKWVEDGREPRPHQTGVLQINGVPCAFIRSEKVHAFRDLRGQGCSYQEKTGPSGALKFIVEGHQFLVQPERVAKMAKTIAQYIEYYANREQKGPWAFQFHQPDEPRADLSARYDATAAANFAQRLQVASEILQFSGKLPYAEKFLSYTRDIAAPWEAFCREEDSLMKLYSAPPTDEHSAISAPTPQPKQSTPACCVSTTTTTQERPPAAPTPDQPQSKQGPDSALEQQATTLERLITITGACSRGHLTSRGTPINVGQLLLELFTICGRRGSDVGVNLSERLVSQYPDSGLAYYILFNAIAARAGIAGVTTRNAMTDEAKQAFDEAIRLGCRNIQKEGNEVKLLPLNERLDNV